jgi:hypothetical protein
MTNLAKASADYIALWRALGFKMVEVSHRLADFIRFARRKRASRITVDLAVRWAKLPATVQPATWATLLRIVRQFAEYLSTLDPRTEIPPRGLLPGRYQRKAPYLYEDDEIQRLLQAARRMHSQRDGGRGHMRHCWGCWRSRDAAQRSAGTRPARRRPA